MVVCGKGQMTLILRHTPMRDMEEALPNVVDTIFDILSIV